MATSSIVSQDRIQDIDKLISTKSFLGREFLTWLWHLSDTKGAATLNLGKGRGRKTVELWIDDRIVLNPEHNAGHESLMRGGNPSKSLEAAIALNSGKSVTELKLGMRVPGCGDFTVSLRYDQLSPRSLRLPPPPEEEGDRSENANNVLLTRLQQTKLFLTALDELFLMFIRERTDKDWRTNGLRNIADWIRSKSRKSDGAPLH